MPFKLKSRNRRGLASIIGTLFFIAIMVAAFTAILAAFSYQNDLIESQRTIAELEIAKAHENFIVKGDMEICTVATATAPPNECLTVTVYNKGTKPVEVDQLWVIQKATPYDAIPYNQNSIPSLEFEDLVIPIADSQDITSQSIEVDPTRLYTLKVVSKLGTIVTADLPDTCPQCQSGEEGQACWDINNNGIPDPVLDPLDPASLGFDTEDRNGDTAINALDCIGSTGSSDPLILHDDLINRPAIFMMFPSPFGVQGGASPSPTGYWGAIIGNPTEYSMDVKKIIITTILTGAPSSDTSFIVPCPAGTAAEWTCGINQITWKASSLTTIPPRSTQSFLVKVYPGTALTAIQNGMPVFASVLTGYGQFGKTDYVSSMVKTSGGLEAPTVNVYRSAANGETTTDVTGDLIIPQGPSSFTTYFTISETSTTNEAFINPGTDLIVNVPKGFGSVTATSVTSGVFDPIIINGDVDKGWNIQARLTQNIGDGDPIHKNARSIAVTFIPPILDPPGDPKLYLFYTLADGLSSYKNATGSGGCLPPINAAKCGQWQVGPIAEIVGKIQ